MSTEGVLIKTFKHLDLSNIPDEVLDLVLAHCSDFLRGAWSTINRKQFQISMLSGGLTNLMYLCRLDDSVSLIADEPREVLLRIQSATDALQLTTEAIVFLRYADAGLGPKLLGVFNGGRLEQYIPSRTLLSHEVYDARFAKHIGAVLFRHHSAELPLPKGNKLFTTMRMWLDRLRTTPIGQAPIKVYTTAYKAESDDYPKTITCDDLEKEIDFVESYFKYSDSPAVFSHCDIVGPNILLRNGHTINEDGSVTVDEGADPNESSIVLIDFEFGKSSFRGHDIGNLFCEFGFDFYVNEPPYYKILQHLFHDEAIQRTFCEAYVEEAYRYHNKDEKKLKEISFCGEKTKDVEKLLKESQEMMILSSLHWTIWNQIQGQILQGMDFQGNAMDRMVMYFDAKRKLKLAN